MLALLILQKKKDASEKERPHQQKMSANYEALCWDLLPQFSLSFFF